MTNEEENLLAMKTPYIKFFVRDWQSCPELRMCSYAARGLWMELMCMMAQGNPRYGYLEINGQPYTTEQIRRITGGDDKTESLLNELETCGVFSRDEKGTIYSRRMEADFHKRIACSEAGKRGGGNLALASDPMPEDGWSLPDVIEVARDHTVAMTAQMASQCYDYYAAAGWMNKHGNPVARSMNQLRALLRNWKNNESSMRRPRTDDPNKPETIEDKRARLMRSI